MDSNTDDNFNIKRVTLRMPMHIGLTIEGTTDWAVENNISIDEAFNKRFEVLRKVIVAQKNFKIPVISFFLLPSRLKKSEFYHPLLDSIANFFSDLNKSNIVHENKIKISILGKWYDLPSRIVDPIKKIIAETKDYDKFFVNFCINYDGHEEIVDACKIISMKVKSEKIDAESINKEIFKDEIYSSFLMPLDLIIKTGKKKTTDGFMLWDSTNAVIYFSNTLWPEFDDDNLIKAIKYYDENK